MKVILRMLFNFVSVSGSAPCLFVLDRFRAETAYMLRICSISWSSSALRFQSAAFMLSVT